MPSRTQSWLVKIVAGLLSVLMAISLGWVGSVDAQSKETDDRVRALEVTFEGVKTNQRHMMEMLQEIKEEVRK